MTTLQRIQAALVRAERENESLKAQRAALSEALEEMRYGHTDKAERMAVAALSYLLSTADRTRTNTDNPQP